MFSDSSSEEEVGMSTRGVRRGKPIQKVKTRAKKKKKTKDRRKSKPIAIVEGVTPASVGRAYTKPNLDNVVARNVTGESVVFCRCQKPFTLLTISLHLSRFCSVRHDVATINARKDKAKLSKENYRQTGLGKVQTFKDNYLARFNKRDPDPEKYAPSLHVNTLDSCWFKIKDNINDYAIEDSFQKQPFFGIGRFTIYNPATHLCSLRIIADWMCDKSPTKVRLSQAKIPPDCRDWLYSHVSKLQIMFHPDRLYRNFVKTDQYHDLDVVAMKEVSSWISAELNDKKEALKRLWDVVEEDGLVPDDQNKVLGNTFAIDGPIPLFNRFELECIEDYRDKNVSMEWLEWNEKFIICRKEIDK